MTFLIIRGLQIKNSAQCHISLVSPMEAKKIDIVLGLVGSGPEVHIVVVIMLAFGNSCHTLAESRKILNTHF